MMNLSELLTNIKMDLGIYGIALPIEDLDTTLYDVIKLKSLKTFSIFKPHKMTIELDIADLDYIKHDYYHSIFRLPDVFGDRRLISIGNVYYGDYNRSVGYATTPELVGTTDLYNTAMMSMAVGHLNSAIVAPFTFKFENPNIIHLYNFSTIATKLKVDLMMEHYDNLMSIPNSAFQTFYELVILDIKAFLYNMVKHYNEIQTVHGSVSLKIDDWQDAQSRREELVNQWKARAHLNGEQFIIA